MAALVPAPALPSPLARLPTGQRATAIAALTSHLPPADAVALHSALAGSVEDVLALPVPLRRRAQDVLLAAFPHGLGAVDVIALALADLGDGTDAGMERARAEIDDAPSMEAAAAIIRQRLAAPGCERTASEESY